MGKAIQKLLSSKFIRDNSVLFIGTVFTGAINYALYPFMSRVVSVEEFGEVQIVLSIILQISVIGTIIRIFIVNTLKEEKDQTVAAQFIRNTSHTMFGVGAGLGLVFVLASPYIKNVLQFESVWPLLPAALAFLFSLQAMIPLAYLQAREDFNRVSVVQFLQGLAKLVFAAVAGIIGLGSTGVVGGVAFAAFIVLVYANAQLKLPRIDSTGSPVKARFALDSLKKEASYITLIGLTLGVVFILLSLDTFFAKNALDPEDAGLYAGVAIVARTLFYLTASIAAVMISAVRAGRTPQQNRRTYLSSLGLLLLAVSPALLIIGFFSEEIVRILVGTEYLVYSNLLFKLSIAMFAVGVINLITSYHVALRENKIIWPAVLGLTTTIALVAINTTSATDIADAFLLGTLVSAGLCGAWSLAWSYKYIK